MSQVMTGITGPSKYDELLSKPGRFVEGLVNESGLHIKGHAVLCIPYVPKKGLIIIPDTVGDRAKMLEDRVVVLEIGPECWSKYKTPRAVVGERVMISKFAGSVIKGPLDGELYRVVNDEDIYLGIEEKA